MQSSILTEKPNAKAKAIQDRATRPTVTGIQVFAVYQTSFLSLLYFPYSVFYQDGFILVPLVALNINSFAFQFLIHCEFSPEKLWLPHPWACSRPGWMGL